VVRRQCKTPVKIETEPTSLSQGVARVGSKSILLQKAPRFWEREVLLGGPDGGLKKWVDMLTGTESDTKPDAPDVFFYALLAVPKHSLSEPDSINKFSPTVATATGFEDLKRGIEEWAKVNCEKPAWDLRRS